MFIKSLTCSDPRFKSIQFRDGLCIVVADRTAESVQGDSRNSIGKTSLVKIMRYVLGGELPPAFKVAEMMEHQFTAVLELPGADADGAPESVTVTRRVSPTTRVAVGGWSVTGGTTDLHVDDWRDLLSRFVFGIPASASRPTSGQMWGQLIRTYFGNPVKGHASEPDWESGVKIGFMLGLSPTTLGKAGDLDRLNKQSKVIREAVREGALAHLSLDEPALRAQLASARRVRDRTQADLESFRVDEQYQDHQRRADRLTALIQRLNDEALALQRRSREIEEAVGAQDPAAPASNLTSQLARTYAEVGLVLPETVSRRFEEVAAFHESVLRNRASFLEQEASSVDSRLAVLDVERRALDEERSRVMRLLRETVALDTFLALQHELAGQDAEVADLERRLEASVAVSSIGDTIKIRTAELVGSVRAELNERSDRLDKSIALFSELGTEIYRDRDALLLVSPNTKGLLKVEPKISGDDSVGVQNVETFMLDMVCAITAIELSRAPRILVHDSHLFDAIDGRQVASCLNIGARLAEKRGFQYIVTLNSDFLETVERQSEGAFDAEPYILDTRLTDATESGGLFGFRFA